MAKSFNKQTSLASITHKGPWAGPVSLAVAKSVQAVGKTLNLKHSRKESAFFIFLFKKRTYFVRNRPILGLKNCENWIGKVGYGFSTASLSVMEKMPNFLKFIALAIPVLGVGLFMSIQDHDEVGSLAFSGQVSFIEWESRKIGRAHV